MSQTHEQSPANSLSSRYGRRATDDLGGEMAQLRFLARLHAQLEPGKVIGVLAEAAMGQLNISSVRYANGVGGQAVALGTEAAHRCEYALERDGLPLGLLQLSRRSAFSEPELRKLESLVTAAVPALANALRHHAGSETETALDPLTGCARRPAFEQFAKREIALTRRHATRATLLLVDVDHLRTLNDFYGRNAGDRILATLAAILRLCCRDGDGVFRLHGAQFAVVLSSADAEGGTVVARRILAALQQTLVDFPGGELRITASIGVAQLQPGQTPDSWLERATAALLEAKDAGRDQMVLAA